LRSPNDSEDEGMLCLLALLTNMKVSYEGDDEILRPHDSSGQFSVKSYCTEMCKGLSTLDFSAKAILKSKAPTKACSHLGSHKRKGSNFQRRACSKGETSSWLVSVLCGLGRRNQ